VTKAERKAANRAKLDATRKEIEEEGLLDITPTKDIPTKPITKSQPVIDEICDRIANDETLVSVCSDKHLPDQCTFLRWVREDDAVRQDYTRARSTSGHAIYNKIADMDQELRADKMGDRKFRVLLDSLKWRAARMHGKYNEKIVVQQEGETNINVSWGQPTPDEIPDEVA